ncbi:hypothetical protein BD311DRAFT_808494 [Dichomitus squalens]|uniref:Uncharacterized protein n=1 Tax=Dichomitus squalens TaxID=114155 RepID=A0A4Q9MIG3_9APHY|nr:hypothetical protein BD311DRAFT_808494 [Dichomitus squalens]
MPNDADESVGPAANRDVDSPQLEWEYNCLHNIRSIVEECGGNPAIQDFLVVRPEYLWLREAIVTGYLQNTDAMVTVFLLYLLLYRLERKLPTAIQLNKDSIVVFNADGAAVYDDRARIRFDRQYWALADSNATVISPCEAFQYSRARLIQASPLRPDRWEE